MYIHTEETEFSRQEMKIRDGGGGGRGNSGPLRDLHTCKAARARIASWLLFFFCPRCAFFLHFFLFRRPPSRMHV